MQSYKSFGDCSSDYVQVLPSAFKDMEDSNGYIRQANSMSTAILCMDIVFLIFVCVLAICLRHSHSQKRSDDFIRADGFNDRPGSLIC